ncbi:NADH:ubiquinone oxidoreductase (plasmid) [Bacillus paramycoides]|uniref:NADH:ubiquinone oxidoreductase n=1 Tax=Bacillus paramycoides TaxID=2026194 RepID=UPI003183D58D
MYQNSYPYPYQYPQTYMDNMYREFTSKIGTFFTILNNVPISGGTIPSGTRVFIHNVRRDAAGNEIVTIVFPQMVTGGCIARATDVLGSVLEAPAPVLQFRDQY